VPIRNVALQRLARCTGLSTIASGRRPLCPRDSRADRLAENASGLGGFHHSHRGRWHHLHPGHPSQFPGDDEHHRKRGRSRHDRHTSPSGVKRWGWTHPDVTTRTSVATGPQGYLFRRNHREPGNHLLGALFSGAFRPLPRLHAFCSAFDGGGRVAGRSARPPKARRPAKVRPAWAQNTR